MTRKRDRDPSVPRLSPTHTVARLTDDLIEEMNIPELPDSIPTRLADAVRRRVQALLYCLQEAKRRRYVGALEVRLVRDAHRAVLTAYELGLPDGEIFYAKFRDLVQDLGYERTDIGFTRVEREE
jgi:hypothetical protein